MPNADDWCELIGATRGALASLRVEELNNLAARAEQMRQSVGTGFLARGSSDFARQRQLLADVLHATGDNLAVLQRLRGEETDSRWAL